MAELVKFKPDFFTCTYGAGGSTRDKTLDICQTVKDRFGMKIASHLTCVGSTVDQLRQYLTAATQRGVDYIVALRGDPPKGETEFKPVPEAFVTPMISLLFCVLSFPSLVALWLAIPRNI